MSPRLTKYQRDLASALDAHDRLDTERFDRLATTLEAMVKNQESIAADVKSLLQSRSFTRGVWRAAATVGAIVSVLVTVSIEVVKWFRS